MADRSPFVWGRHAPLPVLMQEAGMPLVVMSRCYRELTELHYDHARRMNFKACPALFIDDTYATALMGGEPFSDWN